MANIYDMIATYIRALFNAYLSHKVGLLTFSAASILIVSSSATLAPLPVLAVASTSVGFVTACGTGLCLDGQPYLMHGSTMYHLFGNTPLMISSAKALHLNTIRIVNQFEQPYSGDPETRARDESAWRTADNAIAALAVAGMHATLDLSDYRNFMLAANTNPYTKDWGPYLGFVANRVNTVTGLRYADDPTIALVSFAGEIEAPKHSTLGVTSAQEVEFYRRTFAEWKALDAHHIITSGGLSYLNWNSGIDYKSIMSLPQGDVCSIHTYSDGDLTQTVPTVARLCGGLGKPWITEEFGVCRSHYYSDAVRAARVQHIYDVNQQNHSAGAMFWNLGPENTSVTCNIGPQFPLTFAAVLRNSPTQR